MRRNTCFAFIKATEGSSFVDPCFHDNYENAIKTGIRVGAYHFFSFDSGGDTQAENFIREVKKIDNMLPPVIDLEFYGDKQSNPPDRESVTEQLNVFIAKIEEAYGVKPIIYVVYEAYELYIKGDFNDCDIWIRDIFSEPKLSDNRDWTFWQFTNRARLAGYNGEEKYIDLNVFIGTAEQFENYGKTLVEEKNELPDSQSSPTPEFSEWFYDEYSYSFVKNGEISNYLPEDYKTYSAKSADLNLDGITDLAVILIKTDRSNDPASSYYELPFIILAGQKDGGFKEINRNDKRAYSNPYGDSTILYVGDGWFKFHNSVGKAGGYENNLLYEYDKNKVNWYLTETYHNSYGWSLFGETDNWQRTTTYLKIRFADKEKESAINKIIYNDYIKIVNYLEARECESLLHSNIIFMTPDVISIQYEIFGTVEGIEYNGTNQRYLTTIIDVKNCRQLKTSDIFDIPKLADIIIQNGFEGYFDEAPKITVTKQELEKILYSADNLDELLNNGKTGYFSSIHEGSLCFYWQPDFWAYTGGYSDSDITDPRRYINIDKLKPAIRINLWEYKSKSAEHIEWRG